MTPLPIIATVQNAYTDVWNGRAMLVRAAALWLALVLLLDGASNFLGFDAQPVTPENPAGAGYMLGGLITLVSGLVTVVGMAAIMVVWHRRILIGETMVGALAPVRRQTIRYLFMEIGITLLGVAVASLALMISMALGPLAPIGVMIGILASVLLTIRLVLVLPAAAVDDKGMTFRNSWQLTKEHWLRLVAGSLLAAIPIIIAAMVLQSLLQFLGGAGSLIGEFVSLVGGAVQATVGAAYLSFSYIHITAKPAAA